ncbi:GlsB/YeaQ/YmgE family stress response membrane protein, partial [Streptomyces sp. ADI98-12]
MGIISWIILGLLAGAIAKIILPGRDPGGFIGTILIGIAGAFIGGWISSRFLDRPIANEFFDPATWVS